MRLHTHNCFLIDVFSLMVKKGLPWGGSHDLWTWPPCPSCRSLSAAAVSAQWCDSLWISLHNTACHILPLLNREHSITTLHGQVTEEMWNEAWTNLRQIFAASRNTEKREKVRALALKLFTPSTTSLDPDAAAYCSKAGASGTLLAANYLSLRFLLFQSQIQSCNTSQRCGRLTQTPHHSEQTL